MSDRTINLDKRLYQYLVDHSAREHPVQRELREATAGMKQAGMQIGPEQGQFMALLVQMLGARRTIEIGVFTGYSALSVALALPRDGKIVACDVSEEWTAIGRKHWEKAGVAAKIDLRLAPALETLDKLIAAGGAGQYDFEGVAMHEISEIMGRIGLLGITLGGRPAGECRVVSDLLISSGQGN